MDFKNASLDEVFSNPDKFGFYDFEHWLKVRNKFKNHEEDKLALAEQGGHQFKHLYNKMTHELEGYRCKSLYEVYKIAKNQGIPIKDLDYRPQLIPLGSGRCDVLVKWVSKSERIRRENAGPEGG